MIQFTPKIVTILKNGYTLNDFRCDLIAGLTVAIVALPLAMALGIASGATPEQGIITSVIAGFLISFLGGSRVQIGGPTGAFVVVLNKVISNHGYEGLVIATIMAGLILIISGYWRLGRLLKFIPQPVVIGFTTGIAILIASTQVKDFFGLEISNVPSEFIPKWIAYLQNIDTYNLYSVFVAVIVGITIFLFRMFYPRLPRYLIGLVLATCVVVFLELNVETVGSKFTDLHFGFPQFQIPAFNLIKIQQVFPSAMIIAFLAGIEALLSAVVADGMTGYKHRPNQELVAQGVSNIASSLCGGLPATGAIARTATNVTAGAKSPIAGMVHAILLFLFVICAGDLIKLVPMPALAAVLMFVAYEMSEVHRFINMCKFSGSDKAVLLITFFLTVFIDLTVGIAVGVTLASLLFVSRMSESIELSSEGYKDFGQDREEDDQRRELPEGVEVFWIAGPLFFGIASDIPEILKEIGSSPKVLIIRMRLVPFLDATGAAAMEDLVKQCSNRNIRVVFSALQKQPEKIVMQMQKRCKWEHVLYANTYTKALELSKDLVRIDS